MLVDLHVHSDLSDGIMSLAEIQSFSRKHYTPVGIADHISPYHKIRDEKTFADYLKALSKFDFLKGGEICLGAELEIPRESLNKLDYLIGSVHAVKFERSLTLFFFDQRVRFPDAPFFINLYTEQIVRFLETEKMDILGHPTLMPLFLQNRNPDELFSDEQNARIVEAGVKNNVAFEISGRWRLPGEKFLRECRRQGARISLGSDGHSPELIGNFDYPLMMIEKIGLDRDLIFVPEKRIAAA